jgi:hypothetical protein
MMNAADMSGVRDQFLQLTNALQYVEKNVDAAVLGGEQFLQLPKALKDIISKYCAFNRECFLQFGFDSPEGSRHFLQQL